MSKEIVSEKDIIQKVADETGYPYKTVHLVWKFILYQMGQMTLDPECMSIRLPYLGVLYEKVGMLKKSIGTIDRLKNPSIQSTRNKAYYRKRLKNLEKATENMYHTVHKVKNTATNPFYVGFRSYAEQEEIQNTKWKSTFSARYQAAK